MKKLFIHSIVLFFLIIILVPCAKATNHDFTNLPLRSDGWTDFQTMISSGYEEARVVFVSNSGNDDTAQVYGIDDVSFDFYGNFLTSGSVNTFATIAAAYREMRNGYPDILLLKRGDEWRERFSVGDIGRWGINGKDNDARAILGAYDTGNRPKLLDAGGIMLDLRDVNFLVVSSLAFWHDDYTDQVRGIDISGTAGNILIEDIRQDMTYKNLVQGGACSNIAFRRSVFVDVNAHDGIFYAAKTDGLLFEESVFFRPRDTNALAPAVYGRHFYLSPDGDTEEEKHALKNVIIRDSILALAERGGIDGRSGGDFDNNLLIRNGVRIGGGGGSAGSIQSGNVRNNVFTQASSNTGSASGVSLVNVDGAIVSNNIFTDATNASRSTAPVKISDDTNTLFFAKNIEISNNIAYSYKSSGSTRGLYISELSDVENISVHDNQWQYLSGSKDLVLVDNMPFSGITFANNTYYSSANSDDWFSPGDTLAGWITESGESGASGELVNYTDPSRTVNSYNVSIGGAPDTDDFLAECLLQSRGNWRTEYTADAVNDYIREGFDLSEYSQNGSESVISSRADVDGSGTTNTNDALLVLRKSLGLDMNYTDWQNSIITGDVNCDESMNTSDALLILRYSLGLDISSTSWCDN